MLLAITGAVVAATATTAVLLFRTADARTATVASTPASDQAPDTALEAPTTSDLPATSDPPASTGPPVPTGPPPTTASPVVPPQSTVPPQVPQQSAPQATPSPPTTTQQTPTPPPPPPAAPSDLTATATGETTISLNWADASTNESGFEVESGGVSRTVGADVEDYVWDGLTAGQTACFRVRAIGDTGVSAWEPETPSSGVCATTSTPAPAVDIVTHDVEFLSDTSTICAGTSPTFRAYIDNAGTTESGFFNIRWLDDQEGVFDGGHQSIPSQGSDTHDHIWYEISSGDHELTFIADFDDTVAESDEGNNVFTLSFTVETCIG